MEKKFHSLRMQSAAELEAEEEIKSGSEGGITKIKWMYMKSFSFFRREMERPQGTCSEVSNVLSKLILPQLFLPNSR